MIMIAKDLLDQTLLSCIAISLIVAIITAHITYQWAKGAEEKAQEERMKEKEARMKEKHARESENGNENSHSAPMFFD